MHYVYSSDPARVSKVTMYNLCHDFGQDTYQNVIVYDFIHPENSTTRAYNFYPGKYPTFTFVTEFEGGELQKLSNVKVHVDLSNGSERVLDAVLDEETGTFISTTDITNYYAPVNVKVATKKITGIQSKATISKGKNLSLKPVLLPITSVEKITYSTSGKKVATVSSNGKITAKGPGIAKITVKAGKKKAYCTITVPGIANVKSSATIKKGKSITLKPKKYGTNSKLVYTSSNTKVAVVNKNGKITGKKKGTVYITVKAGSLSVKCKVTVK